ARRERRAGRAGGRRGDRPPPRGALAVVTHREPELLGRRLQQLDREVLTAPDLLQNVAGHARASGLPRPALVVGALIVPPQLFHAPSWAPRPSSPDEHATARPGRIGPRRTGPTAVGTRCPLDVDRHPYLKY